MRKAQKKQAENFLKLLAEAHDQIRKSMEKRNIQVALRLLKDCQDGAISLGTMIEKSEGGDSPTVTLLEEYCELAYQIYESLMGEQAVHAGRTYKTLRSLLIKIENSVRNGIKVRKEAVFLPYKASMWDSLESIWKAADADQDCDAYVIPIPYYDKNPDGSFREMHYEGDLYPDYVPVTRYESYDFAERRPDMIFIHNPYDNNNYVTSVHPFFYSKNLKQYTEKLVYVPYFILDEVNPEDKKAVEDMAHFCTVPAVMNADKVIVQSEDMRRAYIDVMSDYAGEDTRKIWEEKILGLGSPKIDKVMNTRKEDLEIPEEWLKVIKKPDGSWKKIVFYNTSVTALLKNDEKMLEKMKYVFGIFKEWQKDVALLWRPHPLIKATIESMRPQLWREYRKIVDKYREEGWGIYDDSVDLDRAIMLSDAYYGDESSVVQLCKTANKNVLIQDVAVNSYDIQIVILPYVMYKGNNGIYVLNGKNNLIFHADYENSEFRIVADVEDRKEGYGYIGIVKVDHLLILIPDKSDKFAIFNTIDHSIHYMDIDINIYAKSPICSKPSFYNAVRYKNKLFSIQIVCKALACIDIKTWRIEYIDIHKEIPLKEINSQIIIYGDYGVCEEYLYLPVYGTGYVIAVNMEKNTIRFQLIEKGANISTIGSYKNKIYVFTTTGTSYYEINTTTWEMKKISIDLPVDFTQDFDGSDTPQVFRGSFYYHGFIWLIPDMYSNMIMRLNLKNNHVECVLKHEMGVIFSHKIAEDTVWLCTQKGTVKIDLKTCAYGFCGFTLNPIDENKYINNYKEGNDFLEESDIGLHSYLNYILNSKDCDLNGSGYEKEQTNIYWNI